MSSRIDDLNQDSPAIQAKNLGKMYTLYNQPVERLKHTLLWRLGKDYGRPFWALRNVSFEVSKGETFGVIGRNGSGKSTLLQILAGILAANTGEITTNGRVATLLELGSGFNPEFSGRENVLLNGMILGISRQKMLEKFDEIAAFADIGEFIDQPVKLYSSGMFVRLAFAVATSVEADILLIDEALAVGDIFFRQKCYQRLEKLRESGVAIILVSHAMNEIEQFCQRALLLNNGEPVFLGSAIEAVKRYYFLEQSLEKISESISMHSESNHTIISQGNFSWPDESAFLRIENLPQVSDGQALCTKVAVCNEDGYPCLVFQQGQKASLFFEFQTLIDIEIPIGGAEIVNEKGLIVHGKNSLLYGSSVPLFASKGSHVRFRQDVSLEIHPGEYSFNIGFSTIGQKGYEKRSELPHPDLNNLITVLCILPNAGKFAVTHRNDEHSTQLLHFGIANLPGDCQVQLILPDGNTEQP